MHGENGGFRDRHDNKKKGVWSTIVATCRNMNKYNLDFCGSFSKQVAEGSECSFWNDKDVGQGITLRDRFPRLFALEVNQSAAFKDRWGYINGSWQGAWGWRSNLRGRSLEDFDNLVTLLTSSRFKSTGADTWSWNWDNKGLFSVSKISKLVHEKIFLARPTVDIKLFWSNLMPKKVNIFLWRLVNNAIPVKSILLSRGVPFISSACVFCDRQEETPDHCFFECHVVE